MNFPNIHSPTVWLPPRKAAYEKPVFQPLYLRGQDNRDHAINAIIEIRATWAYVIQKAYYNYRNMYSKLSLPLNKRVIQECQRHKEDFAVYDRQAEMWLIEPKESKYVFCYDGDNFQEFDIAKNTKLANRILVVGKYTILQQEPKFLKETSTAENLFKTFELPVNCLTVGVPGCGKTSYIIKNHSRGSLVLTSCAEGAQDMRSRMAKIYGDNPDHYRGSYRTIDSYLINSRDQYPCVWVDEALMEHPGKLFLVCLFSHCSALFLLGDPNQLPYINRVEVKLLYDKSSIFFKTAKTLNISYRCPVDVMAFLSCMDIYDGEAYSTSKILRSLKCKMFTSLEDIPKSKDTKYLVFKQAEKKLMNKAGYNASTVHEFQGKEAAHVVLVRMSHNLQEDLYLSKAHILVGMSRHKESFIYYTPVTDHLKTIVDKMSAVTDATLKKCQVNAEDSTMSKVPLKTALTSTSYSSQPTPSLQPRNSDHPESSYSRQPPTPALPRPARDTPTQQTPFMQPYRNSYYGTNSYHYESSYSRQPPIYPPSYNVTYYRDNNRAAPDPREDTPTGFKSIIWIMVGVAAVAVVVVVCGFLAYVLTRWCLNI